MEMTKETMHEIQRINEQTGFDDRLKSMLEASMENTLKFEVKEIMQKIVIVDIDGTISKVGDRIKYLQQQPKDWDAFYADCFDDEPIINMVDLVYNLYLQQYRIVFCTGRRESCRQKTIDWFNKYFEPEIAKFCTLLMRPDSAHRHDTIVKPQLILEANINLSDIAFVLEDRNTMVSKWREMGLICLQVAEGDF